MAAVEYRAGSWRVYWRIGGRGGRKQSVTTSNEKRVPLIRAFVEERGHRVTDDEVYRTLFPGAVVDATMPTLREWAAEWTNDDVQPDTLATYRSLVNRWVLPRLGDYRLDALTVDLIA